MDWCSGPVLDNAKPIGWFLLEANPYPSLWGSVISCLVPAQTRDAVYRRSLVLKAETGKSWGPGWSSWESGSLNSQLLFEKNPSIVET